MFSSSCFSFSTIYLFTVFTAKKLITVFSLLGQAKFATEYRKGTAFIFKIQTLF